MATFDVKRVTPLEWAGIGAGAVAFIVSFFPWYSVDFEGDELAAAFGIATSANAWDFAGGLFPVLMLVAAAILLLLPHFGTQIPYLTMIWLGLSAGALVIILLRWLTFPAGTEGVDAGAGFGLFLGLLAALVSGAAAFLTFRNASSRTSA